MGAGRGKGRYWGLEPKQPDVPRERVALRLMQDSVVGSIAASWQSLSPAPHLFSADHDSHEELTTILERRQGGGATTIDVVVLEPSDSQAALPRLMDRIAYAGGTPAFSCSALDPKAGNKDCPTFTCAKRL